MNNKEYVWERKTENGTDRILSKGNEISISVSTFGETTLAHIEGHNVVPLMVEGKQTIEYMKNKMKEEGWEVSATDEEDVLRRTCENCGTILDSEASLNYVVDECDSEYQLCNDCAN